MIKTSNILKQRFVSDFSLPIQVLEDEYFNYYLDLYEPYNQAKTKYNYLLNLIETHYNSNENLFLEDYSKLRDKIISSIENSNVYKEFNSADMNVYKTSENFNKLPKGSVYIENNDKKSFISIDLKKANFQGLKYFNPELVNNTETYNDFIEYHIGKEHPLLDYFIQSKYSRQVIFGKLNMSRNITIQRFMMNLIHNTFIEDMVKRGYVNLISYMTDELILEPLTEECYNITSILKDEIKEKLNFDVEVTKYSLEVKQFLTGNNATLTLYKKQLDDKYKIMYCPNTYFSQVYKILNNEEIVEKDLVFYYEKQLAKFLTELREK